MSGANATPSPSTDNEQLGKTIADMLRQAFRAGRGLPVEEKQQLLAICVASQLQNQSRVMIENVCKSLLTGLSAMTRNDDRVPMDISVQNQDHTSVFATQGHHHHQDMSPKADNTEVIRILQDIIGKCHGDDTELLNSALPDSAEELCRQLFVVVDQMADVMQELGGQRKPVDMSLFKMLEQIKSRLQDQEGALKWASQESFDRLLVSVNPQTAKTRANNSSVKFGPFYKATLFDGVCEKYDQLVTYHEKGHLVRDFRAMYKSHLKLLAKEKQV